jgi:hypothetical protein
MILVKATEESEAGALPTEKELREMGAFNEKMVEAGVMVAGEGLRSSSKGSRVRFADGKISVTDGPFSETKELLAGFWILEVGSKQEAIDWIKQAPFPLDSDTELEIRQIAVSEDFGEAFTDELREQEDRMREKAAAQHNI